MELLPAMSYIHAMDLEPAFNAIIDVIRSIPRSELLIAAVVAMIAGWLGAVMVRREVPMGGVVRAGSTLALFSIMLVVVLQLSRFDPRIDVAVPQLGLPQQVVEGGETRVPLAADGHFWLRAEVNGHPANFLVDTGATLTAVSQELADEAGLEPRRGGIPVRIDTANGSIAAQLTTIENLSFGNVRAGGIDAVIVPNMGPTNVIGMNVLSRLGSWRVEGQEMILVPKPTDRTADLSS